MHYILLGFMATAIITGLCISSNKEITKQAIKMYFVGAVCACVQTALTIKGCIFMYSGS